MSQLHSFINVLKTSELNKLRKIRLIGKEKRVFEYILSFRLKELPSVDIICNDIGITSTHFYKISSVVLDKFYSELVPERGHELLYFLNRRDLYNHFTHEMLMQEKELKKNNSPKDKLEEFYLNSFKLLQRVSAKNLDEDLILAFGDKYLKSKKDLHEHDKYFVRNSFLATTLFLLKVTKKDIDTSLAIIKELEANEKILAKTKNIQAKFQLNRAMAIYYNHCVSEPQKVITYLADNLEIIKANKTSFTEEDLAVNECWIAEMLYMDSKFEEAYESYTQIFKKYEESLANDFYHHAKHRLVLQGRSLSDASYVIGYRYRQE